MQRSDLTKLDRREVTLWRLVGRYDEAIAAGDLETASQLLNGFKRRLADYQAACDQIPLVEVAA